MNLTVNGKNETIDKESASVAEILKIFDVSQPDMVTVQLNGEFLKKEQYDTTMLKDSDEVDFLYFMGGGDSGSPF